jgi:3-mercaptopyruvate sulfurtransferase SseA
MQRTRYVLLLVLLAAFILSACSAQTTQAPPASAPTTIVEPGFTQSSEGLPQTDAEVPRVSLEEAKAALDSGAAILVDVRSPDAFAASHAVGAISIPLGEIERNITGLALEKDQWIITYCT